MIPRFAVISPAIPTKHGSVNRVSGGHTAWSDAHSSFAFGMTQFQSGEKSA